MTAPTTEVQVTAARARWRADLLQLDAAERRRIAGDDSSSVAAGIAAEATRKEAEATIHLDVAEAEERLSIAKQERNDNLGDEIYQMRYVQAAEALAELRRYWRQVGEYTGTRRPVLTVDDFPEPTDEDVLATHGGSN